MADEHAQIDENHKKTLTGVTDNAAAEIRKLLVDGNGRLKVSAIVDAEGGGGTPGGADTQVQFNDSGAFAGSSKFTFNKTTGRLQNQGELSLYVENNKTGTDNGLTIEQVGAGDAVAQFVISGSQRYVMGIDNSDGDKFKISASADLGSDTVIEMATDKYLSINNGIKLTATQKYLRMKATNNGDDWRYAFAMQIGSYLQLGHGASGNTGYIAGNARLDYSRGLDGGSYDSQNRFVPVYNSGGASFIHFHHSGDIYFYNLASWGGSSDSKVFPQEMTHTMTVSKNGNVGIGTTSPTGRLEIKGTLASIVINSDGNAINSTETLYLQSGGNTHIKLFISGTTLFTDIQSKYLRHNSSGAVFEMNNGSVNLAGTTQITFIASNIEASGVSQTGDITFMGRYNDGSQHDHNVDIKMTMIDNAPSSKMGFVFAGIEQFSVKNDGKINMASLPTSSVGLSTGDLYNDNGVVRIK